MQLNNNSSTQTSHKTRNYALAVMVFISCLFIFFSFNMLRSSAPLSEDAFITFRNVENFLNGNGFVFNKLERVETISNILWALWLVLLAKLGSPILFSSAISGLVFSLLTIWSIWLFSIRHLKRKGYYQFIAVLLFATHTGLARHSLNGLETSLYIFLITIGTLRAVVENKNKSIFPYSAVIFSFASITRPEAPLLFIVVFIQKILSDIKDRKINSSSIYYLCTFFAVYGFFFLCRILYYHDICPNTIYARFSSSSNINQVYSLWIRYITDTKSYIIFVPALLLLFRKKYLKKINPIPLVVVVLIVMLFYSTTPLHFNRYMTSVLPLAFLLVQEGFYAMSRLDFMKNSNQYFKRLSMITLLTVILFTNLFAHKVTVFFPKSKNNPMINSIKMFVAKPSRFFEKFLILYDLKVNIPDNFQALFGDWIRKNLPANTTIVYDQMGQTPYYAGLDYTFLDSWGLTDKTVTQIAHKEKNFLLKKVRNIIISEIFGLQLPAPEKTLTFTKYLLFRNPDYVFIYARSRQTNELINSKSFHQKYTEFFPQTPHGRITAYRKINTANILKKPSL